MTDMEMSGERLVIGALGADVVLRPAGAPLVEGELTFDVIGRPHGLVAQPHVHPDQVERFEVISGEMRLVVGRRRRILRAGDRGEVPAGVAHRQQPSGSGDGHVRVTISPAGRTEEFLRHLARLSGDGQFNRFGFPRPVAAAKLILDYEDAGHAAVPPVPAQRLLARLILSVPRLWRDYVFVDEWDVAAPAAAVFTALSDARTYPEWWRPVYREVNADGPPRLGAVADQHFKGRLPYHLRTRAVVVGFEPPARVEAEVDGDLRGRGIWTVTPAGSGTHVRFDWTVHADRRLLRLLTPFLRPLLRWNHNWAIARARAGLEPYAAARARAEQDRSPLGSISQLTPT